jgi:hypothetical protein
MPLIVAVFPSLVVAAALFASRQAKLAICQGYRSTGPRVAETVQ